MRSDTVVDGWIWKSGVLGEICKEEPKLRVSYNSNGESISRRKQELTC